MHTSLSRYLYVAAAVSLLWGVALFMGPETMQSVLSHGPYDPAITGIVGAAFFAFALLFFIAALNPTDSHMHASIIVLALLSLVMIFQIFVSGGMPQKPATFFTLLINLSIGLVLFFSVLQAGRPAVSISARARRRPRPARRARARHTKKASGRRQSSTAMRRRPAGKRKSATRTAKKTRKKTASARRKRR
ncbi:MAG: hypothetical protein ACE5K1_04175 [Acidiferrobacterales bacterium]